MNKIKFVAFFLLYTNNYQAMTPNMALIANKDLTKANGDDMQSSTNAMFKHSQSIFPNDNPMIRYFQANDGSLNNGIFNKATGKASTDLHSYTNVIMINGTKETPLLNNKSQYQDSKSNFLESVGIFNEYSENDGQSQIYYLFGKISSTAQNKSFKTNIMQNNAQPKIDFNSYSTDNDGFPGIN